MTPATTPTRPDTTMGRALATRALTLAADLDVANAPSTAGLLDLTTSETPEAPPHVRDAAKAALDRGETHYTTRPGIAELRQAIARRSTDDGFPTSVDGVVVTNGAAEALYIALQTFLAPGDRLLVPDPILPNVAAMVRFLGAELVRLPTDPAGRFVPSVTDVAASDAPVLLLTSPSPITGVAIPPAELARLVAAALDAAKTVILDRALATALDDPALGRLPDPALGARVVTLGSFSTGHGLAGWRVGWFAAPEANVPELRELKQAMSICTTAVSQYAALAALDGPQEWLADRRLALARRRDAAVARLASAGLSSVPPDAAPALLIDSRPFAADDRRAAVRLRDEAQVVVAPGSPYGPATAGFVRVDLGAGTETLRAGIERIAALAERGTR